ncbi:MFS transporter [Radicibacter daui]|uniref:MFS transporter n=1 Tax=Radicibacter daui TaxID=3064829 RepID=UPI0040469338
MPVAGQIAGRLDRLGLTSRHVLITLICAFGFGFDLLEVALGNALSAVFSAPPSALPRGQLTLLLSSVYIGAIVGAPLIGWLADRYGRKPALAGILLFLALSSGLAGLSQDTRLLILLRGLSGLAIGAYPPVMIAYLTDILPPRYRGSLVLLAAGFASLAMPLALFLVRWLTPLAPLGLEAWRWGFLVGAAGAAVIGVLCALLPESPRWLAARGRREKALFLCEQLETSTTLLPAAPEAAEAAPQSVELSAAEVRKRSLLLAGLYFFAPWATVGFVLLSGAVLIEKGFRLSDTLLYVAVATFGPTIGSVLAAFVVDKVERRTALALCCGGMAVLAIVYALCGTPFWLMAVGTLFNILSAIYTPALVIYAAELFGTGRRARVTSSAWAINRLASALVPVLLLPVLHQQGVLAMFTIIAAALVISLLLVLVVGPKGLAGKAVS